MKSDVTKRLIFPALAAAALFSLTALAQEPVEDVAEPGAEEEVVEETTAETATPEAASGPPETAEPDPSPQSAVDTEDPTLPPEDGDEPASEPDPVAAETPSPAPPAETPEVGSPDRSLDLLVHPVFPPSQAELVFQPLVDYLNEATPYEVSLVTTRDFHKYWLDARQGVQAQLVLEDAHMAAWRMARFNYQPLVKSEAPLTFSLLTTADYADESLQDFVARRISTLPSPSLGYVILSNWFSNPMQQPRMMSNAQSWMDAVEIIFGFEADAAMVPAYLVGHYPNLHPVETSDPMPGLTLSAGPGIDEHTRNTLREALIGLPDHPDHFSALNEINVAGFVEANGLEYEGLEQLLDGLFAL